MCFAEERRQHGDREEEQQPGQLNQQHAGQRNQRDEVLRCPEQQREQPDSAGRLATRALQVVVDLGVLELRQVERRGMLHQPDAEPVREEVAEQTLEQ